MFGQLLSVEVRDLLKTTHFSMAFSLKPVKVAWYLVNVLFLASFFDRVLK